MDGLANAVVEGYKKAVAVIEDFTENLVDSKDAYDRACALLKAGDYEALEVVIGQVQDEEVILRLLHKACQFANVEAVSILCQKSVNQAEPNDVTYKEEDDCAVLVCSMDYWQEIAETAIDALIRYKPTDRHQSADPEACLTILIDAGFDIHYEVDNCLLSLCVHHQNLSMLRLLLSRGCNPNHIDGRDTPLMHVIEADMVHRTKTDALDSCRSRLETCSSAHKLDSPGLAGAASWMMSSENKDAAPFAQMFRILIEAGANVNTVTAHGSILHCAVETLGYAERATAYDLCLPAYVLTAPGLNGNAVDAEGRTPLFLALMTRCVHAATQIMQLPECDVNVVDSRSFMTLHLAACVSSPILSLSLLHQLTDLGADMNRSLVIFHPMCIAIEAGHWDSVEFLLKHGMRPTMDTVEWIGFFGSNVDVPNLNDELNEQAMYIAHSGLHFNIITVTAMIAQHRIATLMAQCVTQPAQLLMIEAVLNWSVNGNEAEKGIKKWYLDNVLRLRDTVMSVSLFNLARITVRHSIGCVHLHKKIHTLKGVPDIVKTWLKLDA